MVCVPVRRSFSERIISPYRRTNHALSHLYHDIQCTTRYGASRAKDFGIRGLWYKREKRIGIMLTMKQRCQKSCKKQTILEMALLNYN